MIPEPLRPALSEYRRRLGVRFPGRVQRVVLFGSWARGEATEESDVDVLVILADGTSRERLDAIGIGAEVGFDHSLLLEPVALSNEQWSELVRRERLFAQEVERDGEEVAA